MTRAETRAYIEYVRGEVDRRLSLGGYSTDAETMLKYGQIMLAILQHLDPTPTLPKRKK